MDSGDIETGDGFRTASPGSRAFFVPADNAARRQLGASILVLVIDVGGALAEGSFGPVVLRTVTEQGLPFVAGERGLVSVLGSVAYTLPALLIVGITLAASRRGTLAAALRFRSAGSTLALGALALGVFTILNALGAWPFSWRGASSGARPFAAMLMGSRQWLAVAVWIGWVAIAAPLIEEIAIRFGLLRYLAWKTGSAWAGVIGSSAVFAICHLGNVKAIDVAHVNNAGWAFALSLVLGARTVSESGNITDAIIVHVARNGLEIATLFAYASTT